MIQIALKLTKLYPIFNSIEEKFYSKIFEIISRTKFCSIFDDPENLKFFEHDPEKLKFFQKLIQTQRLIYSDPR